MSVFAAFCGLCFLRYQNDALFMKQDMNVCYRFELQIQIILRAVCGPADNHWQCFIQLQAIARSMKTLHDRAVL